MKWLRELYSREPIKRAVRTFIQTASSSFAVNFAALSFIDMDDKALKAALASIVAASIAAGIAAAMNPEKKEDEANG